MKKKKALRLADRCDRLSESIDSVCCEISEDRLERCLKHLDSAIFDLACAAGELLKEATRKPK